jgi:N,N'-diacetyllegionaminate synthase
LKIGKRIISHKTNPFIIGEIGINHNGLLDNAIKLIDYAKDAGFEAVKFQTYNTNLLLKKKTRLAAYQKKKIKDDDMFSMLKKYELSFNNFYFLKKYCDKKKIIFLSTPFDEESANFLNSINVKAFKISSGDFDNLILLEKIKKFKKPIILSTGMSGDKEIKIILNQFKDYKNKLSILHCISDYPTPLKDIQINQITKLRKFNDCVGFSDHTQGFIASALAISLGARIIEKHITLDNQMDGPDHSSSLNKNQFKEFIKTIIDVKKVFSNDKRYLTKSEVANKQLVRKSLFFKDDYKKNQLIKKSMLLPLRPKKLGISPINYKKILNKRIIKDVKKNEQIKEKYFK